MTSCACDACAVLLAPTEARTPDGYCAFCAAACTTPATLDGRPARVALGGSQRHARHAIADAAVRAGAARGLDPALARSAVAAVVPQIAPQLARAARALVGQARRLLGGGR